MAPNFCAALFSQLEIHLQNTATDSCFILIGAHQCGIMLENRVAAISMCIHHKLKHLWYQQKQHKLRGASALKTAGVG